MSETTAFLNRQTAAEEARFWVLPAPLDSGAEMLKGQAAAPASILGASAWLEPYDEEIAAVPSESAPICTFEALDSTEAIQRQSQAALEAFAVPVILGGDPSVSLPGLRALSQWADDFTLLHISARSGCRDEGQMANSLIRRALDCENLKKVVQLGVSSFGAVESEILFGEEERVETYFACDLARREDEEWHEDLILSLSTPVYVSLDLSALNRAVVPSVGLPEPGGLAWWDLLHVLKKVSGRRRIAAFDVVDLIPIEGDLNGDFAAARLIHKLMAYMVASGKMLDPAVDGVDDDEGEEEEE